jgi:hypothetical protein
MEDDTQKKSRGTHAAGLPKQTGLYPTAIGSHQTVDLENNMIRFVL